MLQYSIRVHGDAHSVQRRLGMERADDLLPVRCQDPLDAPCQHVGDHPECNEEFANRLSTPRLAPIGARTAHLPLIINSVNRAHIGHQRH
jgi:hypothetical protein